MDSDDEKEAHLLARKWNPPGELGGSTADPGDPVACIATTYCFEASYFELELLPRFLGLEFDSDGAEMSFLVEREDRLGRAQVVVLVNAEHYDPRQASSRWLQLPVRVPRGRQHSKVSVLVWENLIRVIVASANLNKAGYRRNREVAAVLDFFDSEDSVPRQALVEALGFIKEIRHSEWVRGGNEALARLDEALAAADAIQRRWKKVRDDFRPMELPRLAFAPTMPAHVGKGVARSPLTVVKQMWGARSAADVTVVTPFVGEPPESAEAAITRLRELFPRRTTAGHLAVPGDEHNGETYTKIPASFWEAWQRHWSRPGMEPELWVVKPRRPADDLGRSFHAKALIVENGQHILLLCGSSNFSIHGS
jgi:phosphatidylserine/phosphatidylglycerophosphate/cardiolipin synthase-like enzyme